MRLNVILDKFMDACGISPESYIKDTNAVTEIMNEVHNPVCKSQLFPYKYFCGDSGIFINDNNSGGFVMELAPQVGIADDSLKQMESFLNDQLPQNSYLQFLMIASSRVEHILSKYEAKLQPINQDQAEFFKKRLDYIRKIAAREHKNKLKVRDFRLFMSFSCCDKSELELIETAKVVKLQIEGLFDAMRLNHIDVEPQSFIDLVDEIVHPTATEPKKFTAAEPLKMQLTRRNSALIHLKDKLLLGDGSVECRTFTISEYPKNIIAGCTRFLLGDAFNDSLSVPCNFAISYTFSPDISDARKISLKDKGSKAISHASTWFGQRDYKAREAAAEWSELTAEFEKQRIFSECFQVMLTDKIDSIDKSEQLLRSIFSANRWRLVREDFVHLPSFLGMLPMMPAAGLWEQYRHFQFLRTALLSKIIALLPLSAEWKGTNEQAMLFTQRQGQLSSWSPFVNEAGKKNYNCNIVAPSGGGKSVLMQDLANNILAHGAQIFVFDIGRSYENLCMQLAGEFIQFKLDKPMSLNPFTNIPLGDSEVEQQARADCLEYAKNIVAVMASPTDKIGDLARAIISQAVDIVWEKYKQQATITLISEQLRMEGSIEASNLSRVLYQYTKNGGYGKYFEGPATIDFKNKFIVIEFGEIAEKTDLLAVMMQVMSVQIIQRFIGVREKFMLVFDEAWKYMSYFIKGLESYSRTIRKYLGSLAIVTQGYRDFSSTEIGKVIWDNSTWQLFLAHDSDAVNTLRETGHFTEPFLYLLESVKLVRNQYSEVLIRSNTEMVVNRLMLDKYSQKLYSTQSADFNKVRELMKNGISITEAIEQMAEQEQ